MQVTKKQLQEMIKEAVQALSITSNKSGLNESIAHFMSIRELLNKARDASFKFEQDFIKILELQDPDAMTTEKRTDFLHIMRAMERGVVKAVADAITATKRANIPLHKDDVELTAPGDSGNPGVGSKTAAQITGHAVTPSNQPLGKI